jgi:preprotein translocase subunit SecB
MEEKKPYKLHAIQLNELRVTELSIQVDLSVPRDAPLGSFSIETARSSYDADDHRVQVKMRVLMGKEQDEKAPFQLAVELYGLFEVDEAKFDVQFVEDWAEKNAPLVLYPYLREQVYGLTGRAGFPEALLPLFEVPTFRVTPPIALQPKVEPEAK